MKGMFKMIKKEFIFEDKEERFLKELKTDGKN